MSERRDDHGRRFIGGFAAGAVCAAAVAVVIAGLTGGFSGTTALPTDARDVIEQSYWKPVKAPVLNNASVNGMISALKKRYDDRFSHYFDPKALRQFEESNSGQFSGVGLTVSGVKAGLRVASVLPDSPAKRAHIEADDLIVGVNGRSIAGVPEEVAVSRIKGPPGTSVTLRVRPAHGGGTRTVHLQRATVELPIAPTRNLHAGPTKVGYVHFLTFSAGSHGELESAVQKVDREGAKGLVLDLRGNGGGELNEAVLSASLFLKEGQRVVTTRSRTLGTQKYDAVGNSLPPRPMVVLMDHNTASSAEILASALAEHHVATTVGTRSFGKGTFQQVIHLAAGGALDLTVGRYYTANGSSLLGKGIVPDVQARDDPKTKRDEALDKALSVLAEKIAVENR